MRKFFILLLVCIFFIGCNRKVDAKSVNFDKSISFTITKGEGKISNIFSNNKVTIMNFFTSTCGGCKEELPGLVELQNEFGKRVNIVGVLGENINKKDALKFLNQYNINFPVINQSSSVKILSDAVGGVFGVPVTVVFDKDGKPIQKFLGVVPTNTLRKSFQGYL